MLSLLLRKVDDKVSRDLQLITFRFLFTLYTTFQLLRYSDNLVFQNKVGLSCLVVQSELSLYPDHASGSSCYLALLLYLFHLSDTVWPSCLQ